MNPHTTTPIQGRKQSPPDADPTAAALEAGRIKNQFLRAPTKRIVEANAKAAALRKKLSPRIQQNRARISALEAKIREDEEKLARLETKACRLINQELKSLSFAKSRGWGSAEDWDLVIQLVLLKP